MTYMWTYLEMLPFPSFYLILPTLCHHRCVIHYQLPATADTYIHRSGRTARAEEDGVSIALVTPREAPRWNALLRALARPHPMPSFPLDRTLMPQAGGSGCGCGGSGSGSGGHNNDPWCHHIALCLYTIITYYYSVLIFRTTIPYYLVYCHSGTPVTSFSLLFQVHQRVKLAMKLDDLLRADRKHRAETAWARNNAEAAGLNLEDEDITDEDEGSDEEGRGGRKVRWRTSLQNGILIL